MGNNTQACQKWSKDDDHLRLITQTVGPLPKEVIVDGTKARMFYNGEKLKKVDEEDIQVTSIMKQLMLKKKTWFQFSDLRDFSCWLQILLAPDPRARATAYQGVKHSFLKQGREHRKEGNVADVVEVSERVLGTIEAAEDGYPNGPRGSNLVQKKLVMSENKLEYAVKMVVEMKEKSKKENDDAQEMVKLLVEMKERLKKQDKVKTEELTKLKLKQVNLEETIVKQGNEIKRLKEKVGGESAQKESKLSRQGRIKNYQKLTAEKDSKRLEIPQDFDQAEYQGSEEDEQGNTEKKIGENLGLEETVQVRSKGGKKSRPDFRHQHSTIKAKKVNWGVGSSKAEEKQLKLVSPKQVSKIKDRAPRAGGDQVQLKRRKLLGDVGEVSKPKVAKRASINGGILGVGFKVANLDGYNASKGVCGAEKKHKAKACGKCEGCLRKNFGVCKFCLDKPCFGGSNVIKQKCQERACADPQRTRCEACL